MTKQMTNIHRQGGAALIIGLTLLMALTIIGIGTLSTTSLEHRMVGNMADSNIAFNNTDSSARLRTIQIIEPANYNRKGVPDCANRPGVPECHQANLTAYWWNNPDWFDKNPAKVHEEAAIDSKNPAGIVIEDIGKDYNLTSMIRGGAYRDNSSFVFYRVTTRAHGLTKNTEVVTQQIIRKRIN